MLEIENGFVICLFYFLKAFLILFATIVGSFCAEPNSVEASTQQSIKDAQPQKRHIGLSALSDCDGPTGVVGLHGGLGLGLHGLHGHGYAPSYGAGYIASGGLLSHVGHVGAIGHIGSVGHVAPIGGAILSAPHVVSTGYAPHAPIISSSIVSHAPVITPAVRYLF